MFTRWLQVGAVVFALSTLGGLVFYAGCRAQEQQADTVSPVATPAEAGTAGAESAASQPEVISAPPPVVLPETKAGPMIVMPATKSGRFLPRPASQPQTPAPQAQQPNPPVTPMPATKSGPFFLKNNQ